MKKIRTKKGIASFYLVAMATLLLGVLTVGFSAYVVNEVNRTTNFDLSKSAYDSALAGIQDAKLAIMNYNSCIKQGATMSASAPTGTGNVTCDEILYYMNHPDCYMVGHILGRYTRKDDTGEVLVKESSERGNKMQQAYTCVKITSPTDYRTRLNSSDSTRVIPLKLKDGNINTVKTIRISWSDNSGTNYNNTLFDAAGNLTFGTKASNPPIISLQLMQTSTEFSLSDFDYSQGAATDRGMLYLAPADRKTNNPSGMVTKRYIDITADNKVRNAAGKGFAKSNDKVSQNLPYLVNCDPNSGNSFLCSAEIELPEPVGGTRSDETFMLVVSLPYGGPDTDIAISMCTSVGECNAVSTSENVTTGAQNSGSVVEISNQIRIDSTGRANNLYKRIESRVETNSNQFYTFAYDAIQALGDNTSKTIVKNIDTNVEQDLTATPARDPRLNTYTLSYYATNSNCAYTSNVPAQQVSYGLTTGKFVISNDEPYCGNNITFIGWTTNPSTNTPKYSGGATVEITGDTTLYAIWKEKTYIIKYHNYQIGNHMVYDTQEVRWGSSVNARRQNELELKDMIMPPKVNVGYEIIGWATTQGSTTVQYPVGTAITGLDHDIDLYAVWGKTVTYNFYQLDNSNSPQTASYYNDQVTASINVPTISLSGVESTGYNVMAKGWSTSSTVYLSSGFSQGATATVTTSSTTEYYAAAYYSVTMTYYINGITYEPASQTEKSADINLLSKGIRGGVKEEVTSFRLPSPNKTIVGEYLRGHQLKSWRIGSTSGAERDPGYSYQSNKALNIYAVLEPARFTVKFYSHDGEIYYGAQEFLYDTQTNIQDAGSSAGWVNIPVNYKPDPNKNFYGWSLNVANSTNPTYCANGKVCYIKNEIYNDNNKMYAIWRKDFTIYFNSNKATPDKIDKTLYNAINSTTVTAVALPGITGMTPIAWSTSSSGVSNNWNAGTDRTVSATENWYAAYEYSVKITYDKNSTSATGTTEDSYGTAKRIYSSNTVSHTLSATIKLRDNGFTNTGFSFNDWRIGSTSGTAKAPGNDYSTSTDITAYANWDARIFDVALDQKGGSGGTTKIYEKYGVGYSLDSSGNNQMTTSANNITVPSKPYIITLDYVDKTDTSETVYAVFNGYYNGSTQTIDANGYLKSNTSNLVPSNQTYTASWDAASYQLPANETKTGYNCAWRKGTSSGSAVSGAQSITADTTFVSVCTLATKSVKLKVTSDGYISTSSTAGDSSKVSNANGETSLSITYGTTVTISGNKITFSGDQGSYYAHANTPSQYEFLGWTGFTSGSTITSDVTINGSWELSMLQITITTESGCALYDGNGAHIASGTQVILVDPNSTVQISGVNIVIGHYLFSPRVLTDGYKFDSWGIADGTALTESITITGKIKPKEYKCSDGTLTTYGTSKICVSSSSSAIDSYDNYSSTCVGYGSCVKQRTYSSCQAPSDFCHSMSSSWDGGFSQQTSASCTGLKSGTEYVYKQGNGSYNHSTGEYEYECVWDYQDNTTTVSYSGTGTCYQSMIVNYVCTRYKSTYTSTTYTCASGWYQYSGSGSSLQCYRYATLE